MSPCGTKNYRISLIELFAPNFLYGLYTALFAGSVYVLAFERPKKHYLATSIVLYVAITIITSLRSAQVIIVPSDLTNSYLVGGVSYSCHSIPQTPPMVRGHMAIDLINVFIDIMNAISQVAADGLLIYRCFIIWNRRIRVVLLSIVLLLATTACNLAHVYYDYQLYETIRHGPTKRSLGRSHILSMATVFDTANSLLALSTTVLTTALTAGRIWWISKQLGRDFGMSVGGIYRSAITLVVESGALYSSGQIAQLIVQKSAPQYEGITNYCVSPLLGIAPTLIIVRVGMDHAFETTHASAFQSSAVCPGKRSTAGLLSSCPGGLDCELRSGVQAGRRANHDGVVQFV